jgi:hypothetical protein
MEHATCASFQASQLTGSSMSTELDSALPKLPRDVSAMSAKLSDTSGEVAMAAGALQLPAGKQGYAGEAAAAAAAAGVTVAFTAALGAAADMAVECVSWCCCCGCALRAVPLLVVEHTKLP